VVAGPGTGIPVADSRQAESRGGGAEVNTFSPDPTPEMHGHRTGACLISAAVRVLEALQKGAEFLAARGVESPRLQAEWLLAGALGLPRLQLYLQFDRVLTDEEADRARHSIQRRGRREPLQHILGNTVFCGLELRTGPQALIPRPETEGLAEAALGCLERLPDEALEVLDYGTGSGCLAVVLAVRCPRARCHALDVSGQALSLAGENARLHQVSDRIVLYGGDGFSALPPDLRCHLLVSNPPYIPSAEIATLEPEVRDHDPREALDGGPDGLEVYRVLAREGAGWLRTGGRLLLELGDGQAEAVRRLLEENNWIVEHLEPDYSGRPRVLVARPGSG